jgi:hypothetical protein
MWCELGALPYDVWSAKILPLLDLHDVVRVDTAIVSKIGRDEFSAVLKNHRVPFDDCRVKGKVADVVQWINGRCIKVSGVKIARNHTCTLHAISLISHLVGSISVHFSNILHGMNDGLQLISSNTLIRVNELYIDAPNRRRSELLFVDKDSIVAATIQHFPALSKLTVSLYGQFGPQMSQALSLRGGLLEEVSITAYPVFSVAQVILITANSCPRLRRFTLKSGVTNRELTSAMLALLLRRCPLLEELSVAVACGGTIGSAAEVIGESRKLTKLCCPELVLDGAALAAWVNTDARLVELEVSWKLYATDVDDCAAVVLGRLRELQISDVRATCGLQGALRFTTNLRTLLIAMMTQDPAVPLPLSIVTQIAVTCRHLIYINLSNLAGIDDGDAVDKVFAALAEHNSNLQRLSVSVCSYIGDRTVLAIAAHCPQFRTLDVKHGLRLTDDTLLALVRGCTLLTKIRSYSGTTAVTEAGLVALADHGHTCLEALCVRTSFAVSDSTRELLRERCPKLRLNLIHKQAGFLSPG